MWALSPYTGLHDIQTGRFYVRNRFYRNYPDIPMHFPLFSYGGQFDEYFIPSEELMLFDRNGEPIIGEPVIRVFEATGYNGVITRAGFAGQFELYHIDESGVPVIVLTYFLQNTPHTNAVVFRYINGEWIEIYEGGRIKFFTDSHGNIFLRDNGTSNHIMPTKALYGVTFATTGTTLIPVSNFTEGTHSDLEGWQGIFYKSNPCTNLLKTALKNSGFLVFGILSFRLCFLGGCVMIEGIKNYR